MNQISEILPCAIAAYRPCGGNVRALISAKRSGTPLLRRDITPDDVAVAREQARIAASGMEATTPGVVMAWLKKLVPMVANAPYDEPALVAACEAIVDVCGALPRGCWTPETRRAWAQQPAVGGRLPGTFWPRPAELYAHLRPYADAIKVELDGCNHILAIASQPQEEPRRPATDEEKRAVARQMDELRAEAAAAKKREDQIRKFGTIMPGSDVTLRGQALIDALKHALPKMSPGMREVTEARIVMLERNQTLVAELESSNIEKSAENG
ncbi:hypothetical protein AA103196_3114 [Ameyamaea chiangmaiensis NBRC 103196]|uniref:Uncharacterized protein n=1 Tax=Ameyamaea chiangmaiensis TaxID=442969 RepID=A0A850PAK3_9PROT|nr:hypothetical protein [Ameyamaea chiangmaiensis]MBS4074600.1 hypothetical protein [Ameyamaea chiangmaiensis]NVN39356.1 hypothetical protein [Ameyamaea chiangmaiensis]GBQ72626.1 hypothetical protein AA103196_3114 [Ameyamaea chiangmaiensis NBRC 103196]